MRETIIYYQVESLPRRTHVAPLTVASVNSHTVRNISRILGLFTSPTEGVARYCFHPVCRSGLYRVVLNSLKHIDLHRSKAKVTGMVHCFLKVQSYHKN